MNITIKGWEELTKKFSDKEVAMLEKVQVSINEGAYFLEGEIKAAIAGARSPLPRRWDTGNYARMTKTHANKAPLMATVENDVVYGEFVEFGTHKKDGSWKMVPGQHFRVSLERNSEKIIRHVQTSLLE